MAKLTDGKKNAVETVPTEGLSERAIFDIEPQSNGQMLSGMSSVRGLVDFTPNKFVPNKSSARSMTHNTLHTGKDMFFPLEERSQADQIVLECRVTDYLQEQVERCNSHLKNFQFRLEME